MTATLAWRADPPVCSVADAALKITVLLELEAEPVEPRELDFAVAVVGSSALARGAVRIAGISRAWTPRGLRTLPDDAPVPPFATVHGALEGAGDADVDRLLVLVTRPTLGVDDALPALERAAACGVAVDFVCASADVDSGPLQRAVSRVGGEVVRTERLAAHLDSLRRSAAHDVEFRLALAQDVEPQRLFRSDPSPRVIEAVRFDDGHRVVSWDAGLLPANGRLAHTIELAVPRRRVGLHRLAQATAAAGDTDLCSADITLRCSPDPSEAAYVEPGVMSAMERAEAAWLVEEVGNAFHNGDGRVVSVVLDRLVRHFAASGRTDTAHQLWDARIGFLRTGLLPLSTLNWVRRAVTEG